MNLSLSDQVRMVAETKFVKPARDAGRREVSIPVRELMDILESQGFPRNHTPQICNALQTGKFLGPNSLKITGIDGPKSKTSTTVVIHYRIDEGSSGADDPSGGSPRPVSSTPEGAEARAQRLTDSLRGLLKKEIAAHGGTEAFIRWVRSDDEDAA
jgi:hypothetical protein